MAAVFFGAAAALLAAEDASVSFARFGYPDSLRLVVALLEFAGAAGLLVPRVRFYSALGLGLLMIGATYSHMSIEEWSRAMVPLIVLIGLGWIAFARRD